MAIKISNSTIVDDSRNIVDAGISTFVGVGTFQNDLYVGGTLHAPSLTGGATFIGDDVTTRNLLASGISTFQGNVNVSAGKVGIRTDSLQGKISFPTSTSFISEAIISAGNDLVDYGLYVVDSGTQNYIRQFTSNNYSISVGATKTFRISNADGINSSPSNTGGMSDDDVAFVVNPDTSTELRYNYKKKLETADSGINVVGTTTTGQLNVSGVSTFQSNTTFQGNAYFGDNDVIYLGNSNDIEIRHNGTHSYIKDTGEGYLIFQTNNNFVAGQPGFIFEKTDGTDLAVFNVNSGIDLYHDGDLKFQTTGYGVTVSGGLIVSGVSTFVGVGTFQSDLYVGGDINFTGDLYQNGSLFSGGGGGGGDSYWASTSAGIHTLSSVGIGTTNPKVRLQLDGVLGFGTIQGNAFPSTNILIGDENTGPNLTPKVGGDWKGLNNNFIGAGAGKSTTTGTGNNFFGLNAGENNTTGYYNNFFGLYAGRSNTTGNNNNFFGGYATGIANTSGYYNNFFGNSAGRYNTSGNNNNFFGSSAGYYNTSGRYNNFFGYLAGYTNDTGWHNNFFGYWAGLSNTTGQFNTFIGYRAGEYNTIGCSNHFIGQKAGFYNTVGEYNIFFGAYAGFYSTGSCNIVIGKSAVVPIPSGNNQLAIGIGNSNWINGNENFNIGIGTTNPTTKLHVVGVVSATTYYGDGTNLDNVKVPISATTTSLVAHNATFATIGLSTTITPINTSKKVYVDVSVPVYMNKGASVDFQQMEIDLRRNGTSLMIHQTGLYVGTVVGRQDYGTTVSFHYVDSPSTVGITTYEVFARSQNTTTNYWTSAKLDFSNTGSIIVAPSRITLMEVD